MPVRATPPKDCWTKAEHDAWVEEHGRPRTDMWWRDEMRDGLRPTRIHDHETGLT